MLSEANITKGSLGAYCKINNKLRIKIKKVFAKINVTCQLFDPSFI